MTYLTRRTALQAIAATGTSFIGITEALANALSLATSASSNDDEFWFTVRQAYAIDPTIVNLNNGGVAPSPRSVQDALRRATERANEIPAYEMWRNQEPQIETVRQRLATMFGVDQEEIAITRNASEALETVQLGYRLRAGDEVVTTTQDYPRMLTTWEQRERRDGIVVKRVKYPTPLVNSDDFVDAVVSAFTPQTKVVHISHIVFLTGQILPVQSICRIARERGILSIVDGAHSFAHIPFRRADLDCDVFATSLHKWLSAPIGTGMLYVRKDLIPSIWPLMAAPKTMDADIRKFEEIGTHPAAVHNAIGDAITFHQTIGAERKAIRLRELHAVWTDRLSAHPSVRFLTDIKHVNNQCGLRLVHIEGTDPNKVSQWLLDKHRIFTVAIVHDEFKGLRVAPNVYTTKDEMERFSEAMTNIADGHVPSVKM